MAVILLGLVYLLLDAIACMEHIYGNIGDQTGLDFFMIFILFYIDLSLLSFSDHVLDHVLSDIFSCCRMEYIFTSSLVSSYSEKVEI